MRAPGPSDDPLRFSSGRVGPYAGRLLPVCCPMRALTSRTRIWGLCGSYGYPAIAAVVHYSGGRSYPTIGRS
jgi:hypothetical protein